jgi:hypothetical protein
MAMQHPHVTHSMHTHMRMNSYRVSWLDKVHSIRWINRLINIFSSQNNGNKDRAGKPGTKPGTQGRPPGKGKDSITK